MEGQQGVNGESGIDSMFTDPAAECTVDPFVDIMSFIPASPLHIPFFYSIDFQLGRYGRCLCLPVPHAPAAYQ